MKSTKTIAVLFGGQSAEHDISLISAANIIKNIPTDKYNVLPIAVDRQGGWWTASQYEDLILQTDTTPKLKIDQATALSIQMGKKDPVFEISNNTPVVIDVFFSILHGPIGEDGSMQGLFRILKKPFVGPDVMGSAVGMDKDFMKKLFRDAKIQTSDWVVIESGNRKEVDINKIIDSLGLPLYVKPANMGSSIGISRVEYKDQMEAAIDEAFLYDRKILLEKNVVGKEIEVAVLGNQDPIASCVGQIIPKDGWYSYKSKYFDETGAMLEIPAKIEGDVATKVRQTAIQAYKALGLEGLSRVDLFLTKTNEIYMNEVNTLPGFTSISMYPKLFEESGIPQSDLMDRLIMHALDRHKEMSKLKVDANKL